MSIPRLALPLACCAALLAACQSAPPAQAPWTPLAAAQFKHDWYGEPVGGAPSIELFLQDDHLVLRGARRAQAELLSIDQPGKFMAGLWDNDCAEAFLLNPDSGAYLELNLSPSGAWWACLFRGPRERITPDGLPLAGVVGTGRMVGEEAWAAELRIPLSSLPPELAFKPGHTRANLCFCLGQAPQRYLSWCDLGGGKPDFHRPQHWRVVPVE